MILALLKVVALLIVVAIHSEIVSAKTIDSNED
jgi:surface polysaccharide O-acyltransferase-like enzyme